MCALSPTFPARHRSIVAVYGANGNPIDRYGGETKKRAITRTTAIQKRWQVENAKEELP